MRVLLLAFVLLRAASACGDCHRDQATHFPQTPMAHALEPAATSTILQKSRDLTFQEGIYQSRVVRDGDRSLLTVTDGTRSLSVPLLWAFGLGQAGQTYVFERNGQLFESRVSYFNRISKLDLTLGAQATSPQNIEEAAGRKMDPIDARSCFQCHSRGAVEQGRLQLQTVSPGVGCVSCHLKADEHAASLRQKSKGVITPVKLAKLDAEEMSELCGQCHRTWSQIATNGPRGVNNVRFQPYRLTNSKCYDAADSRIGCAACHDVHRPLVRESSYYDRKCQACHTASQHKKARVCKVAKSGCADCHMPRVELPGAHAAFADHQIRIVRAGAPYPN